VASGVTEAACSWRSCGYALSTRLQQVPPTGGFLYAAVTAILRLFRRDSIALRLVPTPDMPQTLMEALSLSWLPPEPGFLGESVQHRPPAAATGGTDQAADGSSERPPAPWAKGVTRPWTTVVGSPSWAHETADDRRSVERCGGTGKILCKRLVDRSIRGRLRFGPRSRSWVTRRDWLI